MKHATFGKTFAAMAIAATFGLALGAEADATLIAADSFDVPPYTDNTGLNTADPVVSPGWTGSGSAAWSVGSANLQADAISLTNSATPYDDASTGKGTYIASSIDAYRAGHHRMDTYTPEDTYYMSAFVNPGGAFTNTTGREHAVVGFTNFFNSGAFENTSTDNVYGLLLGFRGEAAGAAAGTKDLIIRARNSSGDLADTVLLSDVASSTFHVLAKLEVNYSGGADRVTYWVNASDLGSETGATSTAIATASFDTFAMDTNSRIDRLFVVSNKWSSSFFWDETRFGTDFVSVTAVPEPTTLALFALAGTAVLARRLRQV